MLCYLGAVVGLHLADREAVSLHHPGVAQAIVAPTPEREPARVPASRRWIGQAGSWAAARFHRHGRQDQRPTRPADIPALDAVRRLDAAITRFSEADAAAVTPEDVDILFREFEAILLAEDRVRCVLIAVSEQGIMQDHGECHHGVRAFLRHPD